MGNGCSLASDPATSPRPEQANADSPIPQVPVFGPIPDAGLGSTMCTDGFESNASPAIVKAGLGSCWAFSAVAATEGINKIKRGKLISLSEQELISCSHGEDDGCMGGYMEDAFKFIIHNGGIDTERNYPYIAANGSCNSKKEATKAVDISGFEKVPKNSETALLKAVSKQPVSVAIDAGRNFQHYAGGVFSGRCGTDLNHGVTAVGYGTDDGTKYWIVKNSWGTDWGEKGYIRMERDIDAAKGLCGIAMDASYPTIN